MLTELLHSQSGLFLLFLQEFPFLECQSHFNFLFEKIVGEM